MDVLVWNDDNTSIEIRDPSKRDFIPFLTRMSFKDDINDQNVDLISLSLNLTLIPTLY